MVETLHNQEHSAFSALKLFDETKYAELEIISDVLKGDLNSDNQTPLTDVVIALRIAASDGMDANADMIVSPRSTPS